MPANVGATAKWSHVRWGIYRNAMLGQIKHMQTGWFLYASKSTKGIGPFARLGDAKKAAGTGALNVR